MKTENLIKIAGLSLIFFTSAGLAMDAVRVPSIDAARLHAFMSAKSAHLLIIDIGDPGAFNSEHIPSAINVPYDSLKSFAPVKESRIVVYCVSEKCPLSSLAAKELADRGYGKVQVLRGGLAGWKKLYKTEGSNAPDAIAVKNAGFIFPDELASGLKTGIYLVVDTRSPNEFQAAHIPGAKNIQPDGLAVFSSTSGVTAVICDSDFLRAKQALAVLRRRDIPALSLSGGIGAWVKKKLPLAVGE